METPIQTVSTPHLLPLQWHGKMDALKASKGITRNAVRERENPKQTCSTRTNCAIQK
jgi:hypothetical protein